MFSNLKPQGRSLTAGITVSCGFAFMLFGYDQGVFGGILSCQSFQTTFNNPNTTVQGQMTSSYVLGCVFGAAIAMFTGDILGRRRSIALACCFCLVGGLLQATAYTMPHMIIGRIVAGLGVGINTTTVPMWQSETCKPEYRGKLISIQLTHLVLGYVLADWINFGFTYIPTQSVSWRFPLAFQCVLAILTAVWLPFMVESPRWLCLRGRPESEVQDVIVRLLEKGPEDEQVIQTISTIQSMVAHEAETQGGAGFREIFHNGPQQTFRRILLGAGVNFMQQFGGVNVVAYYLPVVLKRSFGFSDQLALILSAVDSMQWMFWTGMSALVIERIGRRRLLIAGAAGQSLCFAMAALGLGINTKALNGVAVAFLFLYYFFFGLSFLAIPFMYPSEINSHRTRNLGSAIAMVTNWCGVYVIVSVTPVGIENLGWKFYLIFAIVNLVWVPVCWYFYVETAGLSLEEVDRLFEIKYERGSGMTYREAAREAKEETRARLDGEDDSEASLGEKESRKEVEVVAGET